MSFFQTGLKVDRASYRKEILLPGFPTGHLHTFWLAWGWLSQMILVELDSSPGAQIGQWSIPLKMLFEAAGSWSNPFLLRSTLCLWVCASVARHAVSRHMVVNVTTKPERLGQSEKSEWTHPTLYPWMRLQTCSTILSIHLCYGMCTITHQIDVSVCVYIYIHCTHTCIKIHVCLHACMHIYIYVYIYIIIIHSQSHIHTHTYTYTYTYWSYIVDTYTHV